MDKSNINAEDVGCLFSCVFIDEGAKKQGRDNTN